MPLYPHLLLDTAWKASIVPFGDDTTFFAMKAFGGYDMRLAVVLAVIGATLGQMFNWWVGQRLLAMKNAGRFKIPEKHYARAGAFFNGYGVLLLLLSWVPLCNLLVLMAGFCGVRFHRAIGPLAAGIIFHYAIQIVS